MQLFSEATLTWYTILLLVIPLLSGVGLGLYALLHPKPRETIVTLFCKYNFIANLVLLFLLFVGMELRQFRPLLYLSSLSQQLHSYGIDFSLRVDRFSLLYLFLASTLMGLVGRFSFTYLHQDKGFHRFFVLMLFFSLGLHLIVVAGSLNMLFVGWELIGLTSVLLVMFFQERKSPVTSGLYVFLVYRIGDLALLAACVWLHHRFGSTQWDVLLASTGAQGAVVPTFTLAGIVILLLLAAMVKASQFPFLYWLPRAMEGPTPSSALFYGALSTHVGIFLLMRVYPLFARVPFALVGLIAIGALTALLGSLAGRIQADAKNDLAYATIVQLGLMCIEIGMGWLWLVQLHLLGHTILRAYQYLKTPSLLHTYHQMTALHGQTLAPTGLFWNRILPARMRTWLYYISLERSFLWTTTERFLLRPLLHFSRWLQRWDDAYNERFFAAPQASTDQETPEPAPEPESNRAPAVKEALL